MIENNNDSKKSFESEIVSIINSNNSDEIIREKLNRYHENDIAAILDALDVSSRLHLYRVFDVEKLAEIFSYIDDISVYLDEIGMEKAADVLEQMDADDAIDALEDIDNDKREELLSLMDDDSQKDIELITSYSDDEIGSRMTTNFITVHRSYSIKNAMSALLKQAEENDNINTLYVLDSNNDFYGAIDLKDLIIAREQTDINTLISTSYPYVFANEKVSDCISKLKDYAEDSIPVLNNQHKLIGVITSNDIIEAVDDEFGDDYAKLAGLTAEEDLHESLIQSMKKRMPWLLLLLFLGMGVSSVVGVFENLVSKIALIVCFQSLILDMAGNVGTQSLAVTIRVLTDDNISASQKVKFVFKEMKIGAANGLLLGALAFVSIGIYVWIVKKTSIQYAICISGCVGFSLFISMIISGLIGTIVPMLFHKIKVDPAVASGPLITTVNDLVAVLTYYGLSGFLLIEILHLA